MFRKHRKRSDQDHSERPFLSGSSHWSHSPQWQSPSSVVYTGQHRYLFYSVGKTIRVSYPVARYCRRSPVSAELSQVAHRGLKNHWVASRHYLASFLPFNSPSDLTSELTHCHIPGQTLPTGHTPSSTPPDPTRPQPR